MPYLSDAEVGFGAPPAVQDSQYGFLNNLNMMRIDTPMKGHGYAETWPIGETGSDDFPRPKEIPLTRNGIQVFQPDKWSIHDSAGEGLHIDPEARELNKKFTATLSPEQTAQLKLRKDYLMGDVVDPAKKMSNAVDSALRGYLVGQWSKDALDKFSFTPEQRKMLDEFKGYMTSGKKGPKLLNDADVGIPSNPKAAEHTNAVVDLFKRNAMNVLGVADFVAGTPAFLVGTGAQATGTLRAISEGSPHPFEQGREVGRYVTEEANKVLNPVQLLIRHFELGDAYEQAETSKGFAALTKKIDAAGKWVEDATGGRVPREYIPMMVDTLMAGAPGLKTKPPVEVPGHIRKALAEHAQKMKEEGELEAQARTVTPLEEVGRAPVQQQINSMLGIRTPAEQAKITRSRQKDIKQTFGRGPTDESLPPEVEGQRGREYSDAGESQHYAEERLQNEAAYNEKPAEKPTQAGQAEVTEALRTPGEERSPEQLQLLKDAAEARRAYDAREQGIAGDQAMKLINQAYRGKEKGSVSPEALMLMGAAGVGALGGAALDEKTLRGLTLGGLTGAAAAVPFMFRGASVPSGMRQAGAVKAPGGMWHPKAVERLADPLWRTLTGHTAGGPIGEALRSRAGNELAQKTQDLAKWTDSRVKAYLNKYAGTERDPLKDVEVPFGEGTRRWEDIIDESIIRLSAKELDPKAKEGEFGYTLYPKENYQTPQALSSYLSHVGDFLRQNVDPAKLQQYDLVRAVKETSANDARVAKEMEKAAAASTKDLPVYKEYPDGMKWVELKEPEKLTPEQAKSVRRMTEAEMKQVLRNEPGGEEELHPQDRGYLALDPAGKPVKNSYTNEVASGPTPEQAHLAGQLAQEGNQMGHCVGGYCEGVASGESRIFSLRDKKGQSHVTVEVEPRTQGREADIMNGEEGAAPEADAILQIKGKQNRAPNKEYLSYVRDFVKGGKWGEVGDLENTGLVDPQRELKRYPDVTRTRQEALTERFKNDKFVTKDEWQKAFEEAPVASGLRDQRGSIDRQLLMGLGGIGLGALVGSQSGQDKISGAVLGAISGAVLFGTRVGRERLKDAVDKADYAVGVASTRLGQHSPAIRHQFRELDRQTIRDTGDSLLAAVPFLKAYQKLPTSVRERFEIAAWNSDTVQMAELAKGRPELVAGLRIYRNMSDKLGQAAQALGRFKRMDPGHFPRVVKDLKGLQEKLGIKDSTGLEQAISEADSASVKARGISLSDVERSAVVNTYLKGLQYRSTEGLPSYAKDRKIREFTAALRPYYYDLPEAISRRIFDVNRDLNIAKFFGKDLTQSTSKGHQYTNVDASIGNLVGRLVAEGKLDKAAQAEVESILTSRLVGGERAANWWTQQIRGMGHLTLLGNLPSASVQLGDPFMAIFAQGPRAALTSLARVLTGNDKISTRDFHLADHISQEFLDASRTISKGKAAQLGLVGAGALVGTVLADDKLVGALAGATVGWVAAVGTANAVNKAFRISGFTMIDNFGKNIQLNAAYEKYTRLSRTNEGIQRIAKKYKEAFEGDFPQLVQDLRKGDLTENVRSLLFNELADMQPISKSEMSQMWYDSPNAGRLALTLKTFTQKMLDIARRDAVNEIRAGNTARGLRNLTALALILGTSGAAADAARDWILGKAIKFGVGDVLENALKTVGFSEYVRQKGAKEPLKALIGTFLPPFQIMDRIITRDPRAVEGIPVIGKMYYSWELGGREEAELRDAARAKKAGKDYSLSSRAESYKEQKRDKAREKRENR